MGKPKTGKMGQALDGQKIKEEEKIINDKKYISSCEFHHNLKSKKKQKQKTPERSALQKIHRKNLQHFCQVRNMQTLPK